MRLRTHAAVVLMSMAAISLFSGFTTQRELKADIEITAPPELVWKILTDFSKYFIWNPYIYPAEGEAKTGTQLEITLHPGNQKITFRPTVMTAEAYPSS